MKYDSPGKSLSLGQVVGSDWPDNKPLEGLECGPIADSNLQNVNSISAR
jgi:hypothetical protein